MYVRTYLYKYIRTYVCNLLFYVCVDITVRFNQSAYSVTENSRIIQLFLVLSIPSIFNETVQLINTNIDTDNSADGMIIFQICIIIFEYGLYYNIIGGGIDYNPGPYNVTFPIGSTIASFNITIIDDGVLEDDEMFNISITSITNGHNFYCGYSCSSYSDYN